MKPHITKVLKIMQLKAQAAKIYKEIDQLVLDIEELKPEHGSQRFDYDLENLPMCELSLHIFAHELKQNGRYIKFEIIDNLEKLKNGEAVWASTQMKPLTFSSGSLKRCPKSLKE